MISIQITIEEYSTAEDQKALIEAFEQKVSRVSFMLWRR
jgi:hypothetical protein